MARALAGTAAQPGAGNARPFALTADDPCAIMPALACRCPSHTAGGAGSSTSGASCTAPPACGARAQRPAQRSRTARGRRRATAEVGAGLAHRRSHQPTKPRSDAAPAAGPNSGAGGAAARHRGRMARAGAVARPSAHVRQQSERAERERRGAGRRGPRPHQPRTRCEHTAYAAVHARQRTTAGRSRSRGSGWRGPARCSARPRSGRRCTRPRPRPAEQGMGHQRGREGIGRCSTPRARPSLCPPSPQACSCEEGGRRERAARGGARRPRAGRSSASAGASWPQQAARAPRGMRPAPRPARPPGRPAHPPPPTLRMPRGSPRISAPRNSMQPPHTNSVRCLTEKGTTRGRW